MQVQCKFENQTIHVCVNASAASTPPPTQGGGVMPRGGICNMAPQHLLTTISQSTVTTVHYAVKKIGGKGEACIKLVLLS